MNEQQFKQIINQVINDSEKQKWSGYWNLVKHYELQVFFNDQGEMIKSPRELYDDILKADHES